MEKWYTIETPDGVLNPAHICKSRAQAIADFTDSLNTISHIARYGWIEWKVLYRNGYRTREIVIRRI